MSRHSNDSPFGRRIGLRREIKHQLQPKVHKSITVIGVKKFYKCLANCNFFSLCYNSVSFGLLNNSLPCFSIQFWIFTFLRSTLTSSSHLNLCLPIFLPAVCLHSVILLTYVINHFVTMCQNSNNLAYDVIEFFINFFLSQSVYFYSIRCIKNTQLNYTYNFTYTYSFFVMYT